MKRLLLALLLFASPALADTYINEHTTQRDAGYKVIGNGINYESAPGVFSPTDETIADNGTTWSVTNAPIQWVLDKTSRTITMTRGGKSIEFTPKGIYYVDKATWDISKVGDLTAPSISTPDNKTIRMDGLFPNVNMVLYSKKQGAKVAYEFISKAGYPSAGSLGMNPATTWVGVVHEITGGDLPVITADGSSPDWNGTDAQGIKFKAVSDWDIEPSRAVDATGKEIDIRNFLVEKVGKKYFVETVPYDKFLAATFPVEFQGYTEVAGALGANTDYDGEYFMSGYVTPGIYDVTIAAGSIFKVDPAEFTDFYHTGSGTITANGPTDFGATMIIVTSCSDQSVGSNMTAEAECAATPSLNDNGSFIYHTNGGSVSITGVKVMYHGQTYGTMWNATAGATTGTPMTFDSNIIISSPVDAENDDNANTAINVTSCTNWASSVLNVTNNIIDVGGEAIHLGQTCGSGTVANITNNLVRLATGASGDFFNNSACPTTNLRNNTVIGDGTAGTSGIVASSTCVLGTVTDNYVHDVAVGYSVGTEPSVHTDNNCYSCDTGYNPTWNKGASEIELDGVMTDVSGHTAGTNVPDWMDNYHNGVASANIDAGSRTAVTAGLDAAHTYFDGTVDSGVVDIGFHFPASGGAPPAPGGGYENYIGFGIPTFRIGPWKED